MFNTEIIVFATSMRKCFQFCRDKKFVVWQSLKRLIGEYITLERPYELAPGERYCCQFYVPARVKNMAASTRLHKVSTKS